MIFFLEISFVIQFGFFLSVPSRLTFSEHVPRFFASLRFNFFSGLTKFFFLPFFFLFGLNWFGTVVVVAVELLLVAAFTSF